MYIAIQGSQPQFERNQNEESLISGKMFNKIRETYGGLLGEERRDTQVMSIPAVP